MPRFLNTYTGEFVWLAEIGATPYAILSHTWHSEEEGGEQTFDDIVKLQTECPIKTRKPWNVQRPPPVNIAFFSHPKLSDKIKRACEVARKAGYRLIWIDSCCIDKRSSAELSEAINSMYALYRDADVCYVYLADVPKGTDPRAECSKFWESRWHKRGWTLQELIAPPYVVFLTCDWTFLGTKMGLASTLEKITQVDTAILLGIKPVESASVAKRMSWAAKRETTRVEDRAYSLLGIFGVHMSPIYGEGTNAFLRLQEEIIKLIPDQSIFVWGWSCILLARGKDSGKSRGELVRGQSGLLAPSPEAFWDVGDVAPITASEFTTRIGRPRDSVPPPLHCVFTPQGARVALINITPSSEMDRVLFDEHPDCPHCRKLTPRCPTRSLALLRCTDRDGHLIALPLHCAKEDVGVAENVGVGLHTPCGDTYHLSPRVVRMSAPVLNGLDMAPTCVEVSILRHSSPPVVPKACRGRFSKLRADQWGHPGRPIWSWYHDRVTPVIKFTASCEQELRASGAVLTPPAGLFQETLGEIILTTALVLDTSSAHRRAHDDLDQRVPPILIEVGLQRGDGPEARFSIDCQVGGPSPDQSQPASPTQTDALTPDCVSSPNPADYNSHRTPALAASRHRQSRVSGIVLWKTSRTIAEVEFVIPDCISASSHNGASTDYVRLLRLKLEYPLESAYAEGCDYVLFFVELSEPFKQQDCVHRL
ncbi:heterokaryon incompatibility protein-domain-containing protein [Lenzites betulinus]|nr:heterokaryon incompatibility protein-domain-containing protein [Lenzites betulinus]